MPEAVDISCSIASGIVRFLPANISFGTNRRQIFIYQTLKGVTILGYLLIINHIHLILIFGEASIHRLSRVYLGTMWFTSSLMVTCSRNECSPLFFS